jgi:hypothetical protein
MTARCVGGRLAGLKVEDIAGILPNNFEGDYMEITFLPPEYLINATREIVGGSIESDFLIRAIKIKNTLADPVILTSIRFDLRIEGITVKRVAYPEETLEGRTKAFSTNVKQIQGEARLMFLGADGFWNNELVSDTPALAPQQETGILLEHFRIVRKSPIDEYLVTVTFTQNGQEASAGLSIPVVGYESKNDYIFPLRGAWLAVNTHNDIHFHRRMHSQEFAMDLMRLTPDFRLIPHPKAANTDYCFYGEDIYAIADGEVTSCFDGIPENPAGLGSRLPADEWGKLKEKHGFVPWAAGNYVILKHAGDEYSFCAHMIPGSLTVKKGDKIKQAQIIGKLGNSGNSDAPHLHFHLMAGPSILSARGLPCRFTNLKDMTGEPLPFIEENNSIVHAE